MPGRGPDLLVAGERLIDQGPNRRGMAERRHAADDLPGVRADEVGAGPRQLRYAEARGELSGVDPVRTAGEHEQRLAGGVEDQAVGDGGDRAADLLRGGQR